jgi:hypothetical protein
MLYNWAGTPYRSKHVDVATVIVLSTQRIVITHYHHGTIGYGDYCPGPSQPQLWETEGFTSQSDMDAWFRSVVKPGVSEKTLMRFRLANPSDR